MLQVFLNPKTGKTSVAEIVSPSLKSGGVLVKNRFSAISPGTERGIIELSKKSMLQKAKERPDYVQKFFALAKTKGIFSAWESAKAKLGANIALGYSSSGEVFEVASDCEEFQVGDRVACAGQDYASHAEAVFVPKNLCAKIPQNVSYEEASFSTLGAIALQGIRQANLTPGEKVAVVGLGLIGQLAAKMLKAYGHPVIGFDLDKSKIDFAKKNGLDLGIAIGKGNFSNALARFTENKGIDAVLVYASSKDNSPLKLAVEIARDKGKIVQVGNVEAEIPWRDFYKKELSFHSSRSYGPGRYDRNYEENGNDYPFAYVRWTEKRNMEEFLRLLSEKKISVEGLISGVFEIRQANKAYEKALKSKESVFGLLLSYGEKKKIENTIALKEELSSFPAEQEINIGIIGLGSFALSTILPNLKIAKDEKTKIIGIADSTGKKASDIGKKWNAEYATSDYRKIIEDKRINLVICATRHGSHAKIAKEVLAANKNLYIEKPLALNAEDLKEILDIASKSRGRLMVGFNRRFSPHIQKAREIFRNSATPLMMLYRVNYPFFEKNHWSYDLKEGGRIIGEDCHFVDTLNFIAGSPLKRVYGATVPTGGAINHEENASLTIEYKNGSIGTIFYSALGNFKMPKEYIEIYGDGKIMVIDDFKKARLALSHCEKNFSLWKQNKGYESLIGSFLTAIRSGCPSPMTLREISEAHRGIFAAYDSAKAKEPKELNE
jgi:predicted dehydrogenase/threonine dehydrogenase-like Zn-dependent dehydrogenase